MCWCADVLMCWCADVLMCWCADANGSISHNDTGLHGGCLNAIKCLSKKCWKCWLKEEVSIKCIRSRKWTTQLAQHVRETHDRNIHLWTAPRSLQTSKSNWELELSTLRGSCKRSRWWSYNWRTKGTLIIWAGLRIWMEWLSVLIDDCIIAYNSTIVGQTRGVSQVLVHQVGCARQRFWSGSIYKRGES